VSDPQVCLKSAISADLLVMGILLKILQAYTLEKARKIPTNYLKGEAVNCEFGGAKSQNYYQPKNFFIFLLTAPQSCGI